MKKLLNISKSLIIILILVLAGWPGSLRCQETEKNNQQKFNDFKISINQDINDFRRHNDSLFIIFLNQAWKEFEAVKNPMPVTPKPDKQPVYLKPAPVYPEKIIEIPTEEIKQVNEDPPEKVDAAAILPPSVLFSYYGQPVTLPAARSGLPVLSEVSKQGIIGYFSRASRWSDLDDVIETLQHEAAEYRLNDWGMASLIMRTAQKYYSDCNEQILFTWTALLHSGFNVKVGYGDGRIFLLIPADVKVYSPSFTINDRKYYVFDMVKGKPEVGRLYIYESDYPDNKTTLSFMITQSPQLGFLPVHKSLTFIESALELQLNKNLVDYYGDYPDCELLLYFRAPLSGNVCRYLDTKFIPELDSLDNNMRVSKLLKYVQLAIKYESDKNQFGGERYLFADETIFYGAADCEDRSILLAKLIDRYTSLDAIGLQYPNHVSLAVNLKGSPPGNFIVYNNKRYYYCDPTYIGAECGSLMPSLANVKPKIIDYSY